MPRLTPEQLARRRKGIGASDVPAILGLVKWRTPYMVWLEKTGKLETAEVVSVETTKPEEAEEEEGDEPEETESEAQDMGHRLEPIVAQLYAERNRCRVREVGTIEGDEPWMLATLDRVASDIEGEREWLVEIKNRDRWNVADYGKPGTDEVPHADLVQVAWQQRVSGLVVPGDLALLVDGRRYMQFTIPYDRELSRMLVETMREWWFKHVIGDTEPEVDSRDAIDYLKAKFAQAGKEKIVATEEMERLLADMLDAKQMLADGKFVFETAKARMMALMQDAAGVSGAVGSISWTNRKGSDFTDYEAAFYELAKHYVPDEHVRDEILRKHSGTRKGSRPFTFRPRTKIAPKLLLAAGSEP